MKLWTRLRNWLNRNPAVDTRMELYSADHPPLDIAEIPATHEVPADPLISQSQYEVALGLRQQGKLDEAIMILLDAVSPPSRHVEHYKLLFKIYRQLNRDAMLNADFGIVVERVEHMLKLDEEMIECLRAHNESRAGTDQTVSEFESYRNILPQDLKHLNEANAALEAIEKSMDFPPPDATKHSA